MQAGRDFVLHRLQPQGIEPPSGPLTLDPEAMPVCTHAGLEVRGDAQGGTIVEVTNKAG